MSSKTIILGAGCFWGVEAAFQLLPGIEKTSVGYSGGKTHKPTYEEVCTKSTGHYEVVQLTYDPLIISREKILTLFFFIHHPTQDNGQGNDIGPQYLSVLFYKNEEEKLFFENYIQNIAPTYAAPIQTKILLETIFYPAEEYHQNYLVKNPTGYCHINMQKVKEFLDSPIFGLK